MAALEETGVQASFCAWKEYCFKSSADSMGKIHALPSFLADPAWSSWMILALCFWASGSHPPPKREEASLFYNKPKMLYSASLCGTQPAPLVGSGKSVIEYDPGTSGVTWWKTRALMLAALTSSSFNYLQVISQCLWPVFVSWHLKLAVIH